MTYLYTVCGLRVEPAVRVEDWYGFSTVAEAEDAEGAFAFAEHDATGDIGDDGAVCEGLALACVHVGDVPSVGSLAVATEHLTPENIQAERDRTWGAPYESFTICGIDRYTWRGLWYVKEARSWLLAFADAAATADVEGVRLLTARIHEGVHPPIGDVFGYADPYALDLGTMRITAAETWRQPWLTP